MAGKRARRRKARYAGAPERRAPAQTLAPLWARRENLLLGAILLVALITLLRSLSNQFVFDDHEMVVLNRYIGQWSFLWKSVINDSWWFRDPIHLPQSSYYRPLQDVWLALNFHLFGLNPVGWHATMVALHLVVVWLVFRLAARLAGDSYVGLAAALLFGVIPIHAEAIVWPSAIPLPLAAAFELGALLLIATDSDGSRNLALAVALYAFALVSHESAVAFPALVALYALLLRPPAEPAGPANVERTRARMESALLAGAPFAIEAGAYLIARYLVLGFINRPNLLSHMTGLQELLTIPHALLTYLLLLMVPWLAAPSHRLLTVSSPWSPEFLLPLLALSALAAAFTLATTDHPRRKLHLFCVAWTAVAIAPMMNLRGLFEQGLIQDRYLYLPSFGWCLLLADLAVRLARRSAPYSRPILAGYAVIALALVGGLWHVQRFWHDEVALFTRCTAQFPEAMIWHSRLGMALKERGDMAGAERELTHALQLEPNDGGTLFDLGMVHAEIGQLKRGADEATEGLKRLPHAPAGAYVTVASIYNEAGERERAEEMLKHAESLAGGYEDANLMRAKIEMQSGNRDGARAVLQKIVRLYPNEPRAWLAWGSALLMDERNDEAVAALSRAIALAPTSPRGRFYLALALHKTGRDREALTQCRLALNLEPGNAQARALIAELADASSKP